MTKACQFLVPSKHPCCKATGRESCKVVRFQCCVQKLMLRCSCFHAKTPGTSAMIQPYFGARWRRFLALNPNGTVVSKHGPALLTERSWTVRCAQWVGDVLCELGTNVAIMKLRVKSGIILQIVSRESPPHSKWYFSFSLRMSTRKIQKVRDMFSVGICLYFGVKSLPHLCCTGDAF